MIEMMGHVIREQFNLRIMFHALQIFTDPVFYLALNVGRVIPTNDRQILSGQIVENLG